MTEIRVKTWTKKKKRKTSAIVGKHESHHSWILSLGWVWKREKKKLEKFVNSIVYKIHYRNFIKWWGILSSVKYTHNYIFTHTNITMCNKCFVETEHTSIHAYPKKVNCQIGWVGRKLTRMKEWIKKTVGMVTWKIAAEKKKNRNTKYSAVLSAFSVA